MRDNLFTKKVPNFRVLCLNWMFSNGQHRQEPTDEEATKTAGLWGPDPEHFTSVADRVMEGSLETDIQNPDAHYTKPPKQQPVPKKARYGPARTWPAGLMAALQLSRGGTQHP